MEKELQKIMEEVMTYLGESNGYDKKDIAQLHSYVEEFIGEVGIDNLVNRLKESTIIKETENKPQTANSDLGAVSISLHDYEYEMFIDDEGAPFEIHSWIPIATDRIKDQSRINEYIKKGLIRKRQ